MSGMKCVKYLLFTFNFFFWIAGLAILGIGIWTKIDAGQFDSFLGQTGYSVPAFMMIAAGGFVAFVAFLGCCGAIKESRCLLGLFFTCLLLIFCCEVAAGILAIIYRNNVKSEIKKSVVNEIKNKYGVTHDHTVTMNVDQLQKRLKCCGADNHSDWLNSKWRAQHTSYAFPLSCCENNANITTCNENPPKQGDYYSEGCIKALENFVDKHLILIGGIGIGISCIQLLGMIFSCCLFCSIDEQ